MAELRYRGVKTLVDTTESAEKDIKGYQIPDRTVDQMARRLKSVTFSRTDRVVDKVRVRELYGYDVIYFVGRDGNSVVITIAGVVLPDKSNPTEAVLQKLGVAAILRGATGI